ncbi:hypothetical protein FE697_007265 [Mumia zhuanghuii]|uniref:DUF2399 domain-containing protein n=2 Tax=Mumia TaxID=1546255 RepID=A0ABW1QKC0_9ACTN|nr:MULTISPECIES: hypothetical protein [Mumia]KAA1423403.1 hypothetical protein FE697_007265 [Mumia zhuanghuii]
MAALDEAIIDAVSSENPVTVRGAYYRLVSMGAIEKTEAGYKTVSRRLVLLRQAGLVPYEWITDGTRLIRTPRTFSGPGAALRHAADSYRRSIWQDEDSAVIVCIEKDALTGVISPVTDGYDVELATLRGYSSETFAHSLARSAAAHARRGKTIFLYQLGDHDPSGVDAWRDIRRKVTAFTPDSAIEFSRLAVNTEQIESFALPTRPTKTTDSRSASFVGESVEVDALPPTILRGLVERAILRHLDRDRLDRVLRQERDDLRKLRELADDWEAGEQS